MDKSKAILILDEMPKRCFNCKLRFYYDREIICVPTRNTISEEWQYKDQEVGRPEWCPLHSSLVAGED